ncbi:MAG: polysaccharide export protein, partial [Muribaculaceae bacterium]|nr:polysaccharide export protein [Muribaculaceae bacterium]
MPGTESTVPVDSATYNSLLSIEPIPQVFGQDIFRGRNLTFEPNVNMATPEDYRLGPGDEVVINIWGNNENNIRETITPEGNIIVSQVGPVYLSGLTVKEANNRVKSALSSIYADIEAEASDISLTLGQLRSIQVNVMGEVMTPGTYRMSPFSTLFSAVYNAGGVAPSGSLRSIEVMRNGRRIASADLYEFLFNGKSDGDIRLQENDVVIVAPYDRIVRVDGSVKRPMSYEMKKGETLSDLIEYAGGMTGNAYG